MIRAANHSSYPRTGGGPADEQLREILAAHERGETGDAEIAELQDEVTTIVVAEQSRAFINIVTDGMIRWEGPLSHVARHLDGFRLGEPVPWLDTPILDSRPICEGPVRRPGAFLVHDFEVAREVAQTPVRVTLPGAVTFARLAEDRHYGDLPAFAEALAAALAAEVADLAAAGADHFQLDEPLLCHNAEDLELVRSAASVVFAAAGEKATTVLSTYFGDLTSSADRIDRLPGTHLGLDMVGGPANFDLLGRLPEGKGVVLGLFDATQTPAEDAAAVAERLAPYRERLTSRDVIVGPQAGLGALTRDQAFDKLLQARYLVEKLEREWDWGS